ncbi:DNA (cytosine-5-)-methyltransferase [Candidatus Stoquefichus massiliensis]|uniref:DNA (cytosine-5-)-methyltransferase n=1 Tax=Candidatus Stoquefichus massiliensis TaxID=1470350 RepID=UPI000485453D|nr:DNA (cytosine-5-)-methyltransferase [Candidatus Stoquefichus massiliensis]
MEKTVVELFAGVGGFRVGLNHITGFDENGRAIENGDWEFVWANQWEPSTKVQHAFDCYCKRFGYENHSNVDISLVDKSEIPNHTLLVGGFPCQDYSVARTLSGEKGIEGKKGVLFWEIAKILEIKQPPFVLLENVDRLLKSPSKQRGRDFGIMLRTFENYGYNVEWRVINAADYGFAQRRRRVYIFAWRKDMLYNTTIMQSELKEIVLSDGVFARAFPIDRDASRENKKKEFGIGKKHYKDTVKMTRIFKETFENAGVMIDGDVWSKKVYPQIVEYTPLKDILDKQSDLEKYILTQKQINQFKELRDSKKKERTRPDGSKYIYSEGAMSPYDSLDLPGRTMLTSEASINRSTHIIFDEKLHKLRFITPIEAERMQEFPDDWTKTDMPEKRRYFMMGNALVTGIIAQLEYFISDIVNDE